MSKEKLLKVLNVLKEKGYQYSLEAYIFDGKYFIREVFINNCEDKSKIANLLNKEFSKDFNVKDGLTWYLGDRRKIVLLKLKKEIESTIAEFEALQTDSYATV